MPEYPQRYTQDNWCITSDVAIRKRTEAIAVQQKLLPWKREKMDDRSQLLGSVMVVRSSEQHQNI